MIKLNLEVSPDVCNLLLAGLAASMNGIGAVMQAIKEQGDAQMQPPQADPEAEVLDKES